MECGVALATLASSNCIAWHQPFGTIAGPAWHRDPGTDVAVLPQTCMSVPANLRKKSAEREFIDHQCITIIGVRCTLYVHCCCISAFIEPIYTCVCFWLRICLPPATFCMTLWGYQTTQSRLELETKKLFTRDVTL